MLSWQTPMAKSLALLIALLAALSVSLHIADLILREGHTTTEALIRVSRFFTILTSLLVVATYGAVSLGLIAGQDVWQAALMLSSAMVGIVYWLLLAGIHAPQGLGVWANIGLHVVVPGAVFLWWLVYAPKSELRFGSVLSFAAWPFIYCSYALVRGQIDGTYPYPFLDLGALGWGPVLVNIAELGAALIIAGALIVALQRWVLRSA